MKTGKKNRIAISILLLSVGLPAPASAAEGARVGDLGGVERLVFEGARTFSAEALRKGLYNTTDFAEIAHPFAPREEYLKAVERKVRFGYQHAGFPDARIIAEAGVDRGRVLVKVEEGARYVCGPVKVTGADKGLSAAIVKRLTVESAAGDAAQRAFEFVDEGQVAKDPDSSAPGWIKALWVKGQPAHCSEYDLAWLKWQVAEAFRDRGFFFSKVEVVLRPDSATRTVQLLVTVLERGPRRTIDRIEVTGNQTNRPAALLRYLDLRPGMELTRAVMSRTHDRLWRAARFLSYKVSAGEPDAAGRVTLRIELEELDGPPPVDQEFSPAEQAVLRARQWLGDLDRHQQDLVFNISGYPTAASGFELVLSPRGGLAVFDKSAPAGGESPPTAGLVVKPGRVELCTPAQGRKLLIPSPEGQFTTFCSLVPNEASSGTNRFNLTMGASFTHEKGGSKVPFRFKLTLSPVACVGLVRTTNAACWFDHGVFIRSNADWVWKSDARTGRILELTAKARPKDRALEFRGRFERKAFGGRVKALETSATGLADTYRPGAPLSSSLAFLIEALFSSKLLDPLLGTNAPSAVWGRLPALAEKLNLPEILSPLDELLPKEDTPADPGEEFAVAEIIPPGADAGMAVLARWLTGLGDRALPTGTWPWTLMREAGFVMQGKGKYTGQALAALYQSDSTGPLGFWAAAELLARPQPALARRFAERGAERLAAADFRRDCEVFLDPHSVVGQCLGRLIAALRDLSDEDLQALAGAQLRAGGEFLRECGRRLREAKDRPCVEVIAPALDAYWERGLKAKTAAALGRLGAEATFRQGMTFYQGSPPDYSQAATLFLQAARQGNAEAQRLVGLCYENGRGVTLDRLEAAKWYRKAAEAGDVEAMNKLAWRIAPKVLLPGRGLKEQSKDTLCQKSGYRGPNG